MKTIIASLTISATCFLSCHSFAAPTEDYSVELKATVLSENPPSLRISWPDKDGDVWSDYTIWRKARNSQSWGNPLTIQQNNFYYDDNPSVGSVWEYKVSRHYT